MDGVQGHDKDPIALVILDLLNFAVPVPVILGTPTISHVVNVIKDKEVDALATPWVNAHVAYLLAVQWVAATKEDCEQDESTPGDYDEIVTTKEAKTIDTFSSLVIQVKTKTAHFGRGDQCDDSGSTC